MNPQKIKDIISKIKNKELTYEQIGLMYGCSKQYVGQLAKKNNLGRKKDDTIKNKKS